MEKPQENIEEAQKRSAIMHINGLITMLGQFGGNGSEIPDLRRLIEKVENGDINFTKAIADADDIFHSKNGMHDQYR